VFAQSLGFKTGATRVAATMSQDVSTQTGNTGGSSLFAAWSGGAAAIQAADLSPNDAFSYQLYFSPGGALLPTNNPNALVFSGSGIKDTLVNATSSAPFDTPASSYAGTPGCGHDAACMWNANQIQIDSLTKNGNLPAVQSCPSPTVFLPGGIRKPLSSFFPGGGGGSTGGAGAGYIFQPLYGPEGNFVGGNLVWGGGVTPQKSLVN